MKKSTVQIVSVLLAGLMGLMVVAPGVVWAHDDCRDGSRWSWRRQYRFGPSVSDSPRSYQPVQVVCAAPVDMVVINVSNSNGSYTPVALRREGGTYVGPRGERYLHLPTEEQLQGAYGLK